MSGLKTRREALGLSLRDVEDITEGKISNAYLSQLENGKIKQPGLAVAMQLAAAYAMPLEKIAEMLGEKTERRAVPTCPSCGQSMWNAEIGATPTTEETARLRKALRYFAEQQTIAERLAGTDDALEWGKASVERRIELMGERKRAHDAAILEARAALAGDA